ncbi:hypothetical protein INR49_006517 [Caranx melampygus]|nr:hypothetical protein INR49_006517 [Caranx melampygus]
MTRDISPLSLMPLSVRHGQWVGASLGFVLPFFPLRSLIFSYFLSCVAAAGNLPGIEYSYGISPKFVCTPIPPDVDPSCYSPPSVPHGPSSNGHNGSNRRGMMSDEAKATILHLRESLVRQKETILDQRETIRELTAKLTLCEGFGGHHSIGHHDNHHDNHHKNHHNTHHENHHDTHHDTHHDNHHDNNHVDHHGHHGNHHTSSSLSHHGPSAYHSNDHHYSHGNHRQDTHHRKGSSHSSFSPEQTGKTLQTLKERLENLQHHPMHPDKCSLEEEEEDGGMKGEARNSSSSYSSSLRELLQRKINALEEQLHSYYRDHHDYGHHKDHHGDHHDDHHSNNFNDHHDDHHDDHHGNSHHGDHHGSGHHDNHHNNHRSNHHSSHRAFMLDFPMRTNYMYGRMKRSIANEIFALTICLRLKAGAGPGLGTPFSYAVPGQANELVLVEWGSNPMELLINDKAVTLPITMTDGKWHHVCVTWSTRDGIWEAYQDGVKKGSGQNLSAWHSIKPGGIFILGQEQDTMGGRFDVTQSFMGELSDLQVWSRVLTPNEIHSQATCAGHLIGDVLSWSEEAVELHGGLAELPFEPCH